jgi:hypothetical protein
MALLVLLAAATRTRIIATNFGFVPSHCFDGRIVSPDPRRLLSGLISRRSTTREW